MEDEVYEITGVATGVSKAGVNFLQPADSFQEILNGFIYRQVLQSRQGFSTFAPFNLPATRIMGIFEHTLTSNNTTQLLVFDTNYLYLWVAGTFIRQAFGGSMAAYAGFNITTKDQYISGTTYPTATNGDRFVFTSPGIATSGGNAIFFWDGTNVKNFCNLADNPNYQAPSATIGATLVNAKYITWFGERLNLISPTTNVTTYPQGILYTGIRTAGGNGDKFNIAGAGMIQADTYEFLTGFSLLGQFLSLKFDRSSWILEKTRDAFNPYFIRKVAGVLGTNSDFSTVSWGNEDESVGKTGVLACDGRESVRIDNKIPYFTQDDIQQDLFNLTYGGFDRLQNQFLWSYVESESNGETQNKVLVFDYEEKTWSIYDQRLTVFGQCDVGLNLTWDEIDETVDPSWAQWDTTEEIWDRIGLGEAEQKTLAGDDLGYVYELNQDFDDYFMNITALTPVGENTVAIFLPNGHPFKIGDEIVLQNISGVPEINNYFPELSPEDGQEYIDSIVNYTPYVVTDTNAVQVNIYFNMLIYGYVDGVPVLTSGTISKPIDFSATTIPFNPYRSIGRRCYVSHLEFLIDTGGGWLKVDAFQNEEEDPYKENILLVPLSTTKTREWVDMTIDNEANFHTFRMKQNSPGQQVKVTSIRIHCQPGGLDG